MVMQEGVEAAIGGGVESITMMQRDSSPEPVGAGAATRRLHGDGRHGRGRRQALQASAAQAQDEYVARSASSASRGRSRTGFFTDEIAPMQVTRAILDKKTGEKVGEEDGAASSATSATAPTRRSKAC